MSKIPKSKSISKSISKQTTSKKMGKISKPSKKSQPALIQTRQSLRLKHTKKDHIDKEVYLPVYFGTASPFLQSVVLCHILENHFSLFEQIQFRSVCRLWHYNVKHIWGKLPSLVLTVKEDSIEPKSLMQNCSFVEKYFDSPMMFNRVDLTIGKNHWDHATIDLLGDLFRNIQHLKIFYELSCFDDTTDILDYFLQKFTKVKSFSLLMPSHGTVRMDFLSRLFEMINKHLAPLHSLHIDLPDSDEPFPALEYEHFHKTLSFLQNFTLNCTVENLGEILQTMGKSLPARWPMKVLSINIGHEKSLSPVSTLFEQNPNLSQIKRLELKSLTHGSSNMIKCLLDHFTQLEYLRVIKYEIIQISLREPYRFVLRIKNFTIELIKTLSKLSHLKELALLNFSIRIYEDRIVQSIPNIRNLTIAASYCLFRQYRIEYCQANGLTETETEFEPNLIFTQFLHSFAKQFPNLQQLTLMSFSASEDFKPFIKNFAKMCFTEFHHLKTLKLTICQNQGSIFTRDQF